MYRIIVCDRQTYRMWTDGQRGIIEIYSHPSVSKDWYLLNLPRCFFFLVLCDRRLQIRSDELDCSSLVTNIQPWPFDSHLNPLLISRICSLLLGWLYQMREPNDTEIYNNGDYTSWRFNKYNLTVIFWYTEQIWDRTNCKTQAGVTVQMFSIRVCQFRFLLAYTWPGFEVSSFNSKVIFFIYDIRDRCFCRHLS